MHAGRPLTVDDANVAEPGSGHVETWAARQPGHANALIVAPAYSPMQGLEVAAALSRDWSHGSTSTQLQAKWLFSTTQELGCNAAGTAGVRHVQGQGNSPFLYGIVTCNSAWGATHFNAGAAREVGSPTTGLWGLAHERAFGAVTVHLEAFGQRLSKPVFQLGARTQLTPAVQIDGTVGHSGGETLFSLGLKVPF